jgi:hypothetical protein
VVDGSREKNVRAELPVETEVHEPVSVEVEVDRNGGRTALVSIVGMSAGSVCVLASVQENVRSTPEVAVDMLSVRDGESH